MAKQSHEKTHKSLFSVNNAALSSTCFCVQFPVFYFVFSLAFFLPIRLDIIIREEIWMLLMKIFIKKISIFKSGGKMLFSVTVSENERLLTIFTLIFPFFPMRKKFVWRFFLFFLVEKKISWIIVWYKCLINKVRTWDCCRLQAITYFCY